MRIARDRTFDEERSRYQLRHCCEDCGHFDPASERCRHEWITEGHRLRDYQDDARPEVLFCKEFELC